jgi:NADPH2 dehydrogenase
MSHLFSPGRIGSLEVRNRIVMSPMQQYRGDNDGHATAYHIHHYARPARGGVGLVMVESTAVAIEGRLFSDDIGIYADTHVSPLESIVNAVHSEGAAIGIQLCHGGRKSKPPKGTPILAPSAISYDDEHGVPWAMDEGQIAHAVKQFSDAACRAVAAGFDAIEIHAAHGYLIHQFLSPLSNQRLDDYGGTFENRGRFLREVFAAVRKAIGESFPLLVRVSATDYDPDGLTPGHVADYLRSLLSLGLDAVDVSTGALLPLARPNIGPEYQVPFAAEIKKALSIPVIAVGLIRNAERAEAIIEMGQADFIAIGRPLLERPDWANDWQQSFRVA